MREDRIESSLQDQIQVNGEWEVSQVQVGHVLPGETA